MSCGTAAAAVNSYRRASAWIEWIFGLSKFEVQVCQALLDLVSY
jgi:hypothetical protein